MIDKLQAHYGFTRMPFGRDLAPGMLHRHAAHNEAVARITWCIAERAIGVITGEVGAGKTASVRTVLAGLDTSRHTIIYLPNPMIGVRGLHEMIVATFGGQPDRSGSRLTAQASAILAAERDERGKTPVMVIDEAHLLRYEQLETIRMLTLCRDRDYAGGRQGGSWWPRSRMSGERHNPRPSRNARSLSGGRYLPVFVVGDAVRARVFSLSLRSAWMYG
jgi:type II secretory pathway predicted ATPase ExeA